MYFIGQGVPQSFTEAEAYLRISAARGYKPGLCSLARWLERLPDRAHQDEARALRDQAAAQDDYTCGASDFMEELPLIETDTTT